MLFTELKNPSVAFKTSYKLQIPVLIHRVGSFMLNLLKTMKNWAKKLKAQSLLF